MLERLFRRFTAAPASGQAAGVRAALAAALAHHSAGRLADAEAAYREILRADPGNIDATHFLGVIAYQQGRLEDAERMIRDALARKPENPPAHNNLGNILDRLGRADEAAASFGRAIELQPDYADALANLAGVRARRGEHDEAAALCRRALALDPALARVQLLLGKVLHLRGERREAIEHYRRALAARPDLADAHASLATALLESGEFDAAISAYRAAAALDPGAPDIHSNLGNALMQTGRLDEAAAACRRALALDPRYAAALCNLGAILERQERPLDAIAAYEQALAVDARSARVHYSLGNALVQAGRDASALEHFRAAVELDPHDDEASWALAMCQVPGVYEPGERPEAARAAFSRELARLEQRFAGGGGRAAPIGLHQPFYLAYQEEDQRALLERFGNLCAGAMERWREREGIAVPLRRAATAGREIRIGVVSGHFRGGSIWEAVIEGWFRNLDRGRFSLHAFHLAPVEDGQTAIARAAASSFEAGARGLRQWTEAIADAQLDAVVYPEVGLDPLSLRLASLRLAPVQAASWGHPQTTGLPTIDYYISAQGMEPEDAPAHYRERLVALPNLGCYYYASAEPPPETPAVDALGLDAGAPILVCPGTPFKYAPQFDPVFPAIARGLGRCRFVFFDYRVGELSARLRRRLRDAFARDNMAFDEFVVFLPWQSRGAFHALLGRAAVYLDTIGYSGFNTAMQAVACGTPIVAREGRFLRGRFGSGILRRLGCGEWVARSVEDYVALATRLARDAGERARMRARMEAGRPALFEDRAPVRALEQFLAAAVRGQA
jgi:predicted O-linked N-acetylglucosamine transferase (SPINDLY family)